MRSLSRRIIWVIVIIVPLAIYILMAYRTDRSEWYAEHDPIQTLSFLPGSGTHGITPNQDDADHYTVYLSSECGRSPCIDLKHAYSVQIGTRIYHDGDALDMVNSGKDMDLEIRDRRGYSIVSGTIVFYFASDLPSMYIDTDSGSMDAVDYDYYHYTSDGAILSAVDESGSEISVRCDIRGRGNTTWMLMDKKPYVIECDSSTSFYGMSAQKKWCLLANAYDGSQMRNWIVLNTARRMDMPATVDCRYVNLYLNGCYAGLYLLCQHVDMEGKVIPVTDGDLLEFMGYETPEQVYFDTGRIYVVVKSPRHPTEDDLGRIVTYVNDTEDLIYSGTNDEYLDRIDLDSWTSMYLLQDFYANQDTDMYSNYMYLDHDSDRLISGPPWDYDVTMGISRESRIWESCEMDWLASHPVSFGPATGDHVGGWLYGLHEYHDSFSKEADRKYRELMEPLVKDMLENDIPQMYERIYPSACMDRVLYPEEYRVEYDQGLDNEYEYLCDWLRARMEWYGHKTENVSD